MLSERLEKKRMIEIERDTLVYVDGVNLLDNIVNIT
jgi:hypothetical protein